MFKCGAAQIGAHRQKLATKFDLAHQMFPSNKIRKEKYNVDIIL